MANRVPVTVIEAAPNRVTAVRNREDDGYIAVQLGCDEVPERKLTKAELGHLAKTDAPPLRALVEFRDYDGEVELGGEVTVGEFEPGQRVKVSAVVDRQGLPGDHQAPQLRPRPGQPRLPQRPRPGLDRRQRRPRPRLQGRGRCRAGWAASGSPSGASRSSGSTTERNLLMLRGSVPGPRNGTVEVRTDG